MKRAKPTIALVTLMAAGALLPAGGMRAQEGKPRQTPSSGEQEVRVADLYAIRLERLRQEILASRAALLPEEFEELAGLIREADSALAAGDLEEASVALLQAEVMLEAVLPLDDAEPGGSFNPEAGSGKWSATWAAIAGADAWQEQIARVEGISESQSSSELNPYAGLKGSLTGEIGGASLGQFGEVRLSRDYFFSVTDGGINGSPGGIGRIDFSHRFSLTQYRDPEWKDFWQAELEGRWEIMATRAISLGPRLRVQRTRFLDVQAEDIFLSYLQSGWGIGATLTPLGGPALGLTWIRSQRHYDERPVYDFRDDELSFSGSLFGREASVTLWGMFIDRQFDGGAGDAGYATMDYRGLYLDLRVQWRFANPWGVDLRSSMESRDYATDDPVIPDYREYALRIGILWQPDYRTAVSIGPLYRVRNSQRTQSSFEDYSTFGLSLEVDVYRGPQWSLQLSTSFESRDYRQDVAAVTPGLSLYSDRDILDHMLLFTWRMDQHWELSATANWNREDDRHWSAQDVQSSLLSIQISRFF